MSNWEPDRYDFDYTGDGLQDDEDGPFVYYKDAKAYIDELTLDYEDAERGYGLVRADLSAARKEIEILKEKLAHTGTSIKVAKDGKAICDLSGINFEAAPQESKDNIQKHLKSKTKRIK